MSRGVLLAVLLMVLMWAVVWPVETELECKGKIPTPSGPAPARMVVDMKLPRWGLDMFGRSKGSFLVSMPGEVAVRYEVVDSFRGRIDVGREDGLGGTFNPATGQVALRIPQGSFSGTCQELY
jgi:hypothetical protein